MPCAVSQDAGPAFCFLSLKKRAWPEKKIRGISCHPILTLNSKELRRACEPEVKRQDRHGFDDFRVVCLGAEADGQERGLAYMKKLADQDLKLYADLTLLTNLLASGESPLVLNDYLHTVEEVKKAPMDWVAWDPVFILVRVQVETNDPRPCGNAAQALIVGGQLG